jgi:hypothetical protein
MAIYAGVNMEFIRCEDKSFAAGLERAAQLGFHYVEPMVHNGRSCSAKRATSTPFRWTTTRARWPTC